MCCSNTQIYALSPSLNISSYTAHSSFLYYILHTTRFFLVSHNYFLFCFLVFCFGHDASLLFRFVVMTLEDTTDPPDAPHYSSSSLYVSVCPSIMSRSGNSIKLKFGMRIIRHRRTCNAKFEVFWMRGF